MHIISSKNLATGGLFWKNDQEKERMRKLSGLIPVSLIRIKNFHILFRNPWLCG